MSRFSVILLYQIHFYTAIRASYHSSRKMRYNLKMGHKTENRKWCFLSFPLLGALLCAACSHSGPVRENPSAEFIRNTGVLGTWWWWVAPENQDRYLEFAAASGVNEIYFYTTIFNNRTGSFIEKAGRMGIKVFLLLDDYKYIWERSSFTGIMNRFTAYQKRNLQRRRFSGLHLDIEPHQHPKFGENYDAFLQDYMDFVVWVCSKYRGNSPHFTVDFDIATWHHANVFYRGKEIILYKALISEADRVFLMAYQDSAAKTSELAHLEIDFAKSLNKQIIIGVETGRVDKEPGISYYGKGRIYFNEQLRVLHDLINYSNYGLSIHHISSWYPM